VLSAASPPAVTAPAYGCYGEVANEVIRVAHPARDDAIAVAAGLASGLPASLSESVENEDSEDSEEGQYQNECDNFHHTSSSALSRRAAQSASPASMNVRHIAATTAKANRQPAWLPTFCTNHAMTDRSATMNKPRRTFTIPISSMILFCRLIPMPCDPLSCLQTSLKLAVGRMTPS
jgi:hypothetical protein